MADVRVCATGDVAPGAAARFDVADHRLCVVHLGDEWYVIGDECSHAELALSEGELTPKGIECWLHGSCLDLRTGSPSSPLATEPVDVFTVEIRDGDVHVDVTSTKN